MLPMSLTFEVFHVPIAWLNAPALLNIKFMFVTALVSHEAIGELNPDLLLNKPLISVIRVVTIFLHSTATDCPGGLNGPSVPPA